MDKRDWISLWRGHGRIGKIKIRMPWYYVRQFKEYIPDVLGTVYWTLAFLCIMGFFEALAFITTVMK